MAPWNDQSGQGSGDGKGQGPWGSGPRQPWGQPPRGPRRPPGGGGGGDSPDLEELLRRARERFSGALGGGGAGPGGEGRRFFSWRLAAAVLALLWIASGIFVVDASERGIVTRFGAYQGPPRAPGLHWHLPIPFESAQVVSVSGQRRLQVGATSDGGEESLMITGDRNIVDIGFTVLYRLSNAEQYVFNVRDQDDAIRGVAESAMREVVGQRNLQAIITTERAGVEQSVEALMQRVFDSYQIGVQVLQVQLQRAAAPREVIESFDDVVRAGSDRQTAINQAEQYRNEVVPRSRGEAAQQIQQAEGYREQVVREANGEAARFLAVLQEYRAAPRVTRQRLYVESMERIYRGADRVIIERGAGAVPYLPLEQLRRSNTGQTRPQPQPQPQPAPQPAPPQR